MDINKIFFVHNLLFEVQYYYENIKEIKNKILHDNVLFSKKNFIIMASKRMEYFDNEIKKIDEIKQLIKKNKLTDKEITLFQLKINTNTLTVKDIQEIKKKCK